MGDRGSDRIFYQGVVRLCQHAGTDLDPELRRGQRQHFAIDLLLGTDEYRTGALTAQGLMDKYAPKVQEFVEAAQKYRLY